MALSLTLTGAMITAWSGLGLGAAGASTPGVTSSTVTIGGIYTQEGFSGTNIGAEAAVAQANATGGINGRKIKLVAMLDDGNSATANQADAQQLVQEDHVLAVVPVISEFFVGALTTLQKEGVPFFGWGIDPGWCGATDGFSIIGACVAQASTAKYLANNGYFLNRIVPGGVKGKSVALVGLNFAESSEGLDLFKAEFEHVGAKVVLQQATIPPPPAVVADYTPYADAVLTADAGKPPAAVLMSLSSQEDAGMYQALRRLGYKGTVLGFSSYDPKLSSGVKGEYTMTDVAPYEQNSAAVAEMNKYIKQVEPAGTERTAYIALAYWSTELFLAALKKAGSDPTRAKIISAMNSGYTFNVPGGLQEVSFPAYHTDPPRCEAVVQSTGTGFKVAVPFTCSGEVKDPLYSP
jgi:ABC-type branched-subunit amino acid transport system substrate-binding protein